MLRTDNYCIFRSKINPKRLLAAGNFETNFKEKTKSKLEKIKVQLLLYDEHQTFPHLQSRQLETSIELEDSQIQNLFQPPESLGKHPFLTSILKPQEDSPKPVLNKVLDGPRHSSPYAEVPDLDYSFSGDDSVSEVSSVSSPSDYEVSPRWYCNSPVPPAHDSLTLEEDLDTSLPSCSTDYSNCINDYDRQHKYAAFFARRLEQRLQQYQRFQRQHNLILQSERSLDSQPQHPAWRFRDVVDDKERDPEEDLVKSTVGPKPELNQEKQI